MKRRACTNAPTTLEHYAIEFVEARLNNSIIWSEEESRGEEFLLLNNVAPFVAGIKEKSCGARFYSECRIRD